jgi:uncharacterized protein YgbK (DUF1537 family)
MSAVDQGSAPDEAGLPPGLLLAYYGDDFTGSAAVMEVMSFAGLSSVMFLGAPSPERLARFRDRRCIGIAGIARSKSPAWMEAELPTVYRALASLDAALLHYKVCSTFDSAPQVGSIGKALDLGAAALPSRWIPLVVGAPEIARYQAFGTLFAGAHGTVHRLDRHPTMSRHPVTPMAEADIRAHLGRQTARRIELIDMVALQHGAGQSRLDALRGDDQPVLAIDVIDALTLAEAGRLVWQNRQDGRFAVGSQGLEYALVAHWRAAGLIPREIPPLRVRPLEQIAVVSGSCSPVTAGQIAHSEATGFSALRLDVTRAVDGSAWQAEIGRAVDAALTVLGTGHSPLVYTARGPDDPAIAALADSVRTSSAGMAEVNDRIGAGLGRILAGILDAARLPRALIAGGDTSGHATLALGIDALSAVAAIAPGSPLCHAYSDDPARDGLELALKGGQIGGPDYFCAVRNGGAMGSA